jgi:hypothetical protein
MAHDVRAIMFAQHYRRPFTATAEAHAVLTDLHNAPILTVGETPGFLGEGGMICFRNEKDRIRFDINLDAARTASLKVGSRLLMMAQIVIGQAPEK